MLAGRLRILRIRSEFPRLLRQYPLHAVTLFGSDSSEDKVFYAKWMKIAWGVWGGGI